jgi:hypothetical protein
VHLKASSEDVLFSREEGILDELTDYEELSDSDEESLTEQEHSKMQESINLVMTKQDG